MRWWLASVYFFLALLSKETAVVFLAVVPAAVFIEKRQLKNSSEPLLVLGSAFVVFLGVRMAVLGSPGAPIPDELMNNPFLTATAQQKLATILAVMAKYFRLMVFPHPLTHDYYPYHIALTTFANPLVWVAGCLLAGIFVVTGISLWRKHFSLPALLLIILPLAMVSNVLFPVGTFMNERFLFVPLIGFSMLMSRLFIFLFQKFLPVAGGLVLVGMVILLFSLKTISRNQVWKDDFTLFTRDVQVSAGSAKANTTAGGALYEYAITLSDSAMRRQTLFQSQRYLTKALTIYPGYTDALVLRGNTEWALTYNAAAAFGFYRKVLERYPAHQVITGNVLSIVSGGSPIGERVKVLEDFIRFQPRNAEALYKLGVFCGREMGQLDKAIGYLGRAREIKPEDVNCLKDLGVAYAMSGKSPEAIEAFSAAAKLTPDDASLCLNLALALSQNGQRAEADEWFARAFALNPSLKR